MNNELFKADPNRLFRKGDIVEIDDHGRNISKSLKKLGLKRCVRYTVTKDESADGYVEYTGDDGAEHLSMFFWLKLVTPVKEAEPFYVERCDTDGCYFIQKDNAITGRKAGEEHLPSTSEWGWAGWTFNSLKEAESQFKALSFLTPTI